MPPVERRTGSRSHALRVLEFDEVLALVAEGAVGPEGAARVRELAPLDDERTIERELDAVDELRSLLAADRFELGALPDGGAALARLAVDGAVLDPSQLLTCARILATARAARRTLLDEAGRDGLVRSLADRLWHDRDLEARIEGSFDDAGGVADGASPELRRIRRDLRGARSRLVQRLETYAGSLPERVRVPDASVTIRSGRYCIPIRREGKGNVGGLVHDASGSGQTLFVEPPLAIEAMNEIRELEVAESREVHRILAELSDALRRGADAEGTAALRATYDALARLDSLRARALFAVRLDGVRPAFAAPGETIRIRGGRHPLLAARGDVVPYDLDLAPDERVLLISGPNAGGKTVLLKSLGLFAALAQSGIVPPVGAETRLPRFREIFAIIGDEQSIEASLSTFGAQARNLARILEKSSEGDLVLIDEIGSATDPAEGAALAAATLALLSRRVRLTVATTHLGDLKGLADEGIPAVNASLQFDSRRLEPTFRLERDRPGRSYALEIASRLGVPREVLEDARTRLDQGHRALDDVLAGLEEEQRAARELRTALETREEAVAATERELEGRRAALDRETREIERVRSRVREQTLLEARSEVEETIERLEKALADAARPEAAEGAKREARGGIERRLRETRARADELEEPDAGGGLEGERPAVGGSVVWSGSGRVGRLTEVRGDRGVVEVDGVRLTVPLADLRAGESADDGGGPGSPAVERRELRERRPEIAIQTELDLRGLRAEEVEAALVPALDAAIVAELPWLRIIHGKGTGTLREVVRELLDSDPRIPGYRAGDPREGGTGVTVVEF